MILKFKPAPIIPAYTIYILCRDGEPLYYPINKYARKTGMLHLVPHADKKYY